MTASSRASAVIDLGAVRHNLEILRGLASPSEVMGIVKADGYGHGMAEVSSVLRASGMTWLGVALPQEALALRAGGDSGRILAWLWSPDDDEVAACVAANIDLAVSSEWALSEVVAAAEHLRRQANIHVKVDTGLTRNGISLDMWPNLLEAVRHAHERGSVRLVGLWSHLADGESAESESVETQERAFRQACDLAVEAGLRPEVRHLGNSGTMWSRPTWDFEVVRSGIAIYGLSPGDALGASADLGLRPAMTLRARLANVKAVPAGTRVSYGGTWAAERDTVVGLVPIGYADGVPRSAGGVIEVVVGGRRVPIVGRVAMDQFVVELGPDARECAGDEVVLFGPGTQGELTADEWAQRLGTIGYEIVTRIGPRVPREYIDGGR